MVLDWIIIIVMLVGLIEGIIKGVIQQVFSLGGLILGIILGTLLYEPFAGLLLSIFRMSDQTARIVAFVIILLLVPMVCGLFGKALSKLIRVSDKIVKKEEKKQSQLYVPVSDFSGFCLQWTWNKVKENAEDLIPDYKKEENKDKKDQKKV